MSKTEGLQTVLFKPRAKFVAQTARSPFLFSSTVRAGWSEREAQPRGEWGGRTMLTPVAHIARYSLSITKRKERDCVQSIRGQSSRCLKWCALVPSGAGRSSAIPNCYRSVTTRAITVISAPTESRTASPMPSGRRYRRPSTFPKSLLTTWWRQARPRFRRQPKTGRTPRRRVSWVRPLPPSLLSGLGKSEDVSSLPAQSTQRRPGPLLFWRTHVGEFN